MSFVVPLPVVVEAGREREVDLALMELNAGLLEAGFRRVGPRVVCALVLHPNHLGAIASTSAARAVAACERAAARGTARLGAVAAAR